ncbi:glycosyltransferase [Sphingomonas fuzhouensis]|uniref:glycosyltransferase n=1 Tax=Sphingomonas fuzhouensis TaxID=3106033 RepID=UPI002AFF40D1|nr:glycosyltransferase [Sphingomonas sp. SGZ-02]
MHGRTDLLDTLPVILCVPARNEEAMLPALLQALAGLTAGTTGLELCVYLDDCQDGSAALLDQAAVTLPFPVTIAHGGGDAEPNAGAARRAAMAMGLERLAGREGVLFTTDADTLPHPDWVAAGCRALAKAEIVAGRIVRVDAEADPDQSRIERYYDRLHRYRRVLDPVPWEARDTHHFSGGANMAMRASAYRRIGGFRPLASGEDATLLDDAARAGLRVRRDGAMLVETSSRREGRIAGGLAGMLRALDAGEAPAMADPRGAAWQWRAQAAARRSYAMIDRVDARVRLGKRIGLTADHILGVARDCPNAEAFAMRVVPASPAYRAMVSLGQAEDILTGLERELCEIAA